MKKSDELKAISILLELLIKDTKAWEEQGCRTGHGENFGRVGSTKTGIKERIKLIRAMLLQVSRAVEE